MPRPGSASAAHSSPSPTHGSDARADGSTMTTQQQVPETPPLAKKLAAAIAALNSPDVDDFGLPLPKYAAPRPEAAPDAELEPAHQEVRKEAMASTRDTRSTRSSLEPVATSQAATNTSNGPKDSAAPATALSSSKGDRQLDGRNGNHSTGAAGQAVGAAESDDEEEFKDAMSTPCRTSNPPTPHSPRPDDEEASWDAHATPKLNGSERQPDHERAASGGKNEPTVANKAVAPGVVQDKAVMEAEKAAPAVDPLRKDSVVSVAATTGLGISEFSHQQLATQASAEAEAEDEWQTMPAYAPYDMYDDDDRLVAREYAGEDDGTYGYAGLGGAGKGYTRVLVDDDAESATSMDDNTQYLFKTAGPNTSAMEDEDAQRDAVSQLRATKDLLTEGQRIAYVGLTRLELSVMLKEVEKLKPSRKAKKEVQMSNESLKMWSQKMMIRLYSHMDISPAEQVMIEQLGEHGVMPQDLTPILMVNASVKNPMAAEDGKSVASGQSSPRPPPSVQSPCLKREEAAAEPPPAYQANDTSELTEPVQLPSTMSTSEKINIDLRWTVLCDLFLVLIADSIYDARSRVLLERVAQALEIPWIDICRFEKKVTDALEMQQNAEKENWNEDEHMESRRKLALKRRYVMMGLATVGGGLVIGLSAGLLAPMIGAGLAAGFTTIGVSGTGTFLASSGAAAIITTGAASTGGYIGGKAAERRTGSVKTFEYRPLHNNKRVNLIVTVSGWMTGKIDDVRLPFSTVDSIMGDIYSVLWEPEMLSSMGDTINILATEALTQGLQQILGSTILISLMAALQLPVVLTKLAYLIDNPWAVSLDRATSAGLILADSIIDRNLGTRPITLVGYSLGSRVIFSCLRELARKGAYGLVQNVYMFGSPVVVAPDEWVRARTVVSGRFVNAYNGNDWILGYLFRLTNGGIRRVAGLAPIMDIPGVENMDVSEFVVGHMDYRTAMPRLLREAGWLVESDEFSEIEEADPEKYQERQRELMTEIEEARKELEKEKSEGKTGRIAAFFRKKKQEKQAWELYEDNKANPPAGRGEEGEAHNRAVLFDVDAIRAELAKEKGESGGEGDRANAYAPNVEEAMFQVKEIKSTLPPMKLDLTPAASPGLGLPAASTSSSSSSFISPGLFPSRGTKSVEMLPDRSSSEHRARSPSYWTGRLDHGDEYYHVGGHEAGDDGIQMTFDTSFDRGGPKVSHGRRLTLDTAAAKDATLSPAPVRTGRGAAQTVPNIAVHDHWADEVEEEFGKEKEITMTFA